MLNQTLKANDFTTANIISKERPIFLVFFVRICPRIPPIGVYVLLESTKIHTPSRILLKAGEPRVPSKKNPGIPTAKENVCGISKADEVQKGNYNKIKKKI